MCDRNGNSLKEGVDLAISNITESNPKASKTERNVSKLVFEWFALISFGCVNNIFAHMTVELTISHDCFLFHIIF